MVLGYEPISVKLRREFTMGYSLEGSLLEVCNCDILCPCWVGEDPDNGTCDAVFGYHFDKGSINGTDVTGTQPGTA